MTEDEFIERELRGIDISDESIAHRKALKLEDALHPNEDPYVRSQRLAWESLPAVCGELLDLAADKDKPDVRQEAREFITGLMLEFVKERQERTSGEKQGVEGWQ